MLVASSCRSPSSLHSSVSRSAIWPARRRRPRRSRCCRRTGAARSRSPSSTIRNIVAARRSRHRFSSWRSARMRSARSRCPTRDARSSSRPIRRWSRSPAASSRCPRPPHAPAAGGWSRSSSSAARWRSIYDTGLDLRKTSHLLIVGDLRVPRVTVRYDVVAPGGRLTIDATPRATSTVTPGQRPAHDQVRRRRARHREPATRRAAARRASCRVCACVDATTLSVDVGPRVAGFRATSQPIDTTTRLTIDVLHRSPRPRRRGGGAGARRPRPWTCRR